MATKTQTKRVSVSKQKLAKQADALEGAAIGMGLEGAVGMAEGEETLQAAGDVARLAAAELAVGASKMTRAVDAELVASRMADLSEVVGEAGVVDMAQGAELLADSDDVKTIGAMISLMSAEDLEGGMELARLAGELSAVGLVTERLQMPVLAAFLDARGEQLEQIAVNAILRSSSNRALAQLAMAKGMKIEAMGAEEVAEGLARMVASEAMAERSAELAYTSAVLAEEGVEQMEVGAVAAEVARAGVKVGVAEVAAGASELGAATALDETAEVLRKKAG